MAKPQLIARETALLLIDIQPDFMPGGALAVAGGDEILGPVRALMRSDLAGVVVATQDWHPKGHVSFASRHVGRKVFDVIQLYGHDQTLWPDHCVQGTAGAELHPDLPWNVAGLIVRSGEDPDVEAYSAFRTNWNAAGERCKSGLAGYLGERGVRDVVICGLAREVCVKWTAEDAAKAGFTVWFVWDATRPIDPASDDETRAALTEQGVHILTSAELV